MRTIELPGCTTALWEYGERDSRGSLLVVHGFRGDHHGLERVVEALGGRHVVAPDLPGFGASSAFSDRAHDIDGYARWLRELVTALALDGTLSEPGRERGPLTLLGHSFGSIVVAAALAGGEWPDAAAAVLVNPIGAPALKGPKAIGTGAAIAYYWAAAKLPARAGNGLLRNRGIVRIMSEAMATTRDRELRPWIHAQHAAYFSSFADRDSLLESFRASVSHDVSEYAARIDLPVLLVAAENDQITPLAAERRLAGLFPDARLEVIPDVGHLIHYEKAQEAAALIDAFLAAQAVG